MVPVVEVNDVEVTVIGVTAVDATADVLLLLFPSMMVSRWLRWS